MRFVERKVGGITPIIHVERNLISGLQRVDAGASPPPPEGMPLWQPTSRYAPMQGVIAGLPGTLRALTGPALVQRPNSQTKKGPPVGGPIAVLRSSG